MSLKSKAKSPKKKMGKGYKPANRQKSKSKTPIKLKNGCSTVLSIRHMHGKTIMKQYLPIRNKEVKRKSSNNKY